MTRRSWWSFWRSTVSRLVDQDSDLQMLRRLFLLYDQRERADRLFRELRAPRSDKPLTKEEAKLRVKGYDSVRTFDSEIRQLEDRFGMSPRARLTLGVGLDDKPALDQLGADMGADLTDGEDDELDTFRDMDGAAGRVSAADVFQPDPPAE